MIMIGQILVAQRQGKHPLADQRRQTVLDLVRRPMVDEAGREPLHQPDRPIRRTQEQRSGIRGDGPAIESGHHGTARDPCKLEAIRATLRRHRGTPPLEPKTL